MGLEGEGSQTQLCVVGPRQRVRDCVGEPASSGLLAALLP